MIKVKKIEGRTGWDVQMDTVQAIGVFDKEVGDDKVMILTGQGFSIIPREQVDCPRFRASALYDKSVMACFKYHGEPIPDDEVEMFLRKRWGAIEDSVPWSDQAIIYYYRVHDHFCAFVVAGDYSDRPLEPQHHDI
jgi:hypothetical protein